MHVTWNAYHLTLLSVKDKYAKKLEEENDGWFNARKMMEQLMEDMPVAPLGKVNTFYNETEKAHYYLASEYDM